LRAFNPDAAFVTAVHEPMSLVNGLTGESQDPRELSGLRVGMLSSIGDPEGFETTVRRLHATVLWHQTFPDHHVYQSADWSALLRRVQECCPEAVVTTEKDWIRLQRWTARPGVDNRRAGVDAGRRTVPLWILGVRMQLLSGEEALDARLAGLYAR
jgi:tetraacyldisaccharide-1-P 4'-kinase